MSRAEPAPPVVLVSSTEPPEIRALGRSSTTPERYGVDVMWLLDGGEMVGVQRKVFPGDFLSSVADDRLSTLLGQSMILDAKLMVLEGRPTFTLDGTLIAEWGRTWNRDQLRACLWSIGALGWLIEWTNDMVGTEHAIAHFLDWTTKGKHRTNRRRTGGPNRPLWGTPSSRDFQIWFLQSLPGIGPEHAEAILDHFGEMPLRWAVTREELMEVPGIGPKIAERVMGVLG